MGRLRGVLIAATALLALVVPSALAEAPQPSQPASQTEAPAPAPVQQGTTLVAPPAPKAAVAGGKPGRAPTPCGKRSAFRPHLR